MRKLPRVLRAGCTRRAESCEEEAWGRRTEASDGSKGAKFSCCGAGAVRCQLAACIRGQPVDALEQHTEVHGGGAAVRVEMQRRLVRTARRFRLAALLERVGSVDQIGSARHPCGRLSGAREERKRTSTGLTGKVMTY